MPPLPSRPFLLFPTHTQPRSIGGIWGYKVDPDVRLLMRLLGFSFMSYTVLITSLHYFEEVSYKAVAYAMIPCALSAITRSKGLKRRSRLVPVPVPGMVGVYSEMDEDARSSFMTAYAVMTSVVAAFILKECDKQQCGI